MRICPAPGCSRGVKLDSIACVTHWWSLPQELRSRIWRLYRTEQGSPAHLAALHEAKAVLVTQAETPLVQP